MKKQNYSRREFIKQNTLAGAGALLSMGLAPSIIAKGLDIERNEVAEERQSPLSAGSFA